MGCAIEYFRNKCLLIFKFLQNSVKTFGSNII